MILCLLQNQWGRSVPSVQCTCGNSGALLQVLGQRPWPGQQGLAASAVKTVIKCAFDIDLFKFFLNPVWIEKKKSLSVISFLLVFQPKIHNSNYVYFYS